MAENPFLGPIWAKITQTLGVEDYLMTLEALQIKELDPKMNTKDEYKQRELTIRL